MNIKLHNKFEITFRGKTYTAYNTLLKNVYNKIANLEQYTSHIAIGSSPEDLGFETKKLGTYQKTFSAETEEICCDPTSQTLYIKKLVNIDDSNKDTFTFCELGLCASDEFDPDIYNHAILKTEEGEVVNITRQEGDNLQIRVTIYLQLTSSSSALFTKGNNKLIARILGDDETKENTLYCLRGENLLANEYMERQTPSLENAVVCTPKITFKEDSAEIEFSAELGEGKTEELLLVFDNTVCLRLNTQQINPLLEENVTVSTPENDRFLELGENVSEVSEVSKDAIENNYSTVKYANKFFEKVESPFEKTYTSSTPRYVSSDGKLIAFIDSDVNLYKNQNYTFKKLNTTQMPAINIFKMFLLGDVILMLMLTEPYIRIFEIEENQVVEKSVSLSNYNLSVFPYKWIDASATIADKMIILGLILDNTTQTPVVVRFTRNQQGTYYDNIARSTMDTAKSVFAIDKNPYCEPMVAFITDTYENKLNYVMEEFDQTSRRYGKSSNGAYDLLKDVSKLSTSGRAVIAQRALFPFINIYYYPEFDYGGNNFSSGVDHFASRDGNYIVIKESDGTFKLYNLHEKTKLIEMDSGIIEELESAENFEFTEDSLLVFTPSKVTSYLMKKSLTRVDNVSASGEYNVKLKRYDLLGAKPLEGVKSTLKLNFKLGEPTKLDAVRAPISRISKI